MNICWKQAVPVFFLGLLLGAVAGSWAHRAAFRRFVKDGPPRPERMLEKLGRELKLDAAQKDAVKKTLETQYERMQALHKEASVKFEERRLDFEAEVKKTLRPEQAARFEELSSRWKARHRRPGSRR